MTSKVNRESPVYLVWEGELILNSDVSQSWRHILNFPSWQNYSSVESVEGPVGKEGEVVILRKDEEGFTFPPYYAKTIYLKEQEKVIWKTYPLDGDDFIGFIDFRVESIGDKTRFRYHTIYEFIVECDRDSDLLEFKVEQYKNFGNLFDSILPKLVELVEADNNHMSRTSG